MPAKKLSPSRIIIPCACNRCDTGDAGDDWDDSDLVYIRCTVCAYVRELDFEDWDFENTTALRWCNVCLTETPHHLD